MKGNLMVGDGVGGRQVPFRFPMTKDVLDGDL